MGLFSKGKIEQRLDALDQNLAASFSKVRQDTDLFFEWVAYLYNVAQQQQRTLDSIKIALENIPEESEIERIKAELQNIKSSPGLELLGVKLAEIEQKLANLTLKQATKEATKEHALPARHLPHLQAQASHLQEKVVKKVSRSSKEYIQHAIKSLIAKYGKISALELRDIIVDEQKLCSKSTFYRLLEELEKNDDIAVISSRKAKAYMQKMPETSNWK